MTSPVPSPVPLRPVRRLVALAQPYRLRLYVALASLVLATALGLAGPWMMQFLVDAIVPGGDPSILGKAALLLFAIFLVQGLAMVGRTYLLDYISLRVIADLRQQLFQRLQGLSLTFYNKRRTGELVSRVVTDTAMLHSVVSHDIAGSFAHTLGFFGALAAILYLDWQLTLFMVMVIPGVALCASILGKKVRALSISIQDQVAVTTTILEEAIAGIRVIQSFVRGDFEQRRFRKQIEKTFRMALTRSKVQILSGPIVGILFLMATIAIVWFGGRQVLDGRLSPGQLVTFIILSNNMGTSIRQVSNLWNSLQRAIGSSARIFEILDTESEIRNAPNAVKLPSLRGHLEIKDMSFSYQGTAKGLRVLEDITLDVQPGEVVALVGPSGAGKSTLMNLIPRFYDPTEGSLCIDGHDLRQVTVESLRRQIALVPQETHLFGGTVRENLLYGRLEATVAEMIEAARAANAHEFIEELPLGYDTLVGERGLRLSGGQRQRIAIARALLKDPRVLLLDEATSALDSESEGLVQEAFERLMKGRTSLVIAHRLSTVQHADRIAVLEAGKLVELGSHRELLDQGGLYARLYRLQFRDDVEPPSASLKS